MMLTYNAKCRYSMKIQPLLTASVGSLHVRPEGSRSKSVNYFVHILSRIKGDIVVHFLFDIWGLLESSLIA